MKFSRTLRASEILQSFEGRKVFAGVELVELACSNLRDFIHRVIEAPCDIPIKTQVCSVS